MWAQEWGNISDIVAPPSTPMPYDLGAILRARGTDAPHLVRYGEGFYKSIGFDALPETFWQRSMLTHPHDRDVVCHASAWDVDMELDVRIKACLQPTADDFVTVHHELGHNYDQMAYRKQPLCRTLSLLQRLRQEASGMYRAAFRRGLHPLRAN